MGQVGIEPTDLRSGAHNVLHSTTEPASNGGSFNYYIVYFARMRVKPASRALPWERDFFPWLRLLPNDTCGNVRTRAQHYDPCSACCRKICCYPFVWRYCSCVGLSFHFVYNQVDDYRPSLRPVTSLILLYYFSFFFTW